jgi:hypothetical protein
MKWNNEQERRFREAIDKMDFTGLDKEIIIMNSRSNAFDVKGTDNQVDCAIATAQMYIDQGVNYL